MSQNTQPYSQPIHAQPRPPAQAAPWKRLTLTALALAALAAPAPAKAAGAERALAGVSIFAPGSVVTRKFGNPSRILVGGVAPGAATNGSGPGGTGSSSGSSSSGSSPYPGSSGSSSGGSSRAGAGLLPGFPGVPTSGGSPGGYPGSGGEFPGASGGSGYPGQGGYPGSGGGYPGQGGLGTGVLGGAATAAPVRQPVTLVYDRANGGSLEFTVSPDKRVVQIRETGYSGSYGTSRGIRLGTSYAAVVGRYGYPEDTTIDGPIINIDYRDTLHCGFQFLDQRLVAIIVAAPD